jgi:hypothetical protein
MTDHKDSGLVLIRGLNDETALETIYADHFLVWDSDSMNTIEANPLARDMQNSAT